MEECFNLNTNFTNLNLNEHIINLKKKFSLNNKILLIQTPQFLFESFNIQVAKNRGYYAYPPTSLQTIAKSISDLNLEINILDLNYELLNRVIYQNFDINNWLSILDESLNLFNPSIIGITCLTEYNDILNKNHPLTALLEYISKKYKKIVIIGDPTPTNEYSRYLKDNLCDFVVSKEGEGKIKFLFDSFYNHDRQIIPTNGIYFKFKDSIEETNGTKSFFPLKGNLIETYKKFPIENYCNVGCLNPFSRMAGQNKIFATFQLTRGCRANCRFCDVTKFMGRGIRTYPVKDVIEDIKFLVKEKGVRHFDVLDDDFLGNPIATKELLQEIIPLREKYGITWSASNGLLLASCTEEIMDLARDSGCIGFRIGIESGNEEMLRRIRKPVSIPVILKKSKMLQNYPEIFIGANFILGLFGEETFGQMLDTFRLAHVMNIDWSSYATFQFTSKETATVENLKSKGGLAGNFTPSKDNNKGEILVQKGILSGNDVFNLSNEIIPSSDQVKQIWFTFNLVGNYINNKNLKPGGSPKKFVSWVESLQISYPYNPYMYLFAGIGRFLMGDKELALKHLENAKIKVNQSEYWKQRFIQFNLMWLLNNFPSTADEVYRTLELLNKDYSQWLIK